MAALQHYARQRKGARGTKGMELQVGIQGLPIQRLASRWQLYQVRIGTPSHLPRHCGTGGSLLLERAMRLPFVRCGLTNVCCTILLARHILMSAWQASSRRWLLLTI